MICKTSPNTGQASLVILLIMAVSLGIGLGVSKQEVVDTQISNLEENSSKAFDAAESGVDYALTQLLRDTPVTDPVLVYESQAGDEYAEVDIEALGGSDNYYTSDPILEGEGTIFWFTNHYPSGEVNESDYFAGTSYTLCYASTFSGALEVNYTYRDELTGEYRTRRDTVETNSQRSTTNGFAYFATPSTCRTAGYSGYSYTTEGIPLVLHVRTVYASTALGIEVDVGSVLPSQGYRITSTGKVEEVNRAVEVVYTWPVAPMSLVNALYSGNSGGITVP